MIKHIVSTSGGADSAATLLLAMAGDYSELMEFIREDQELADPAEHEVISVFADTGNEHQTTLEYLDYMQEALGISITRLSADFTDEIKAKRMFIARDRRTKRDEKGRRLRWTNKAKRRALAVLKPTGNPFLDLCLWKGRFPSRKAQFCTERLKRDVMVSWQLDLLDAGHIVVSWQGVRRDESQNRRNALKFEKLAPNFYAYRPLVDWTKDEVFAYCAGFGLKPNPLYQQGMGRVGCMPCINVSKDELRQISVRFPEHIDKIEEWEWLVSQASKRGWATFFHKVDDRGGSRDIDIYSRSKVRETVEWSKTTRGGRMFDIFAEDIDLKACESKYAKLCE
jgi:3'-phosphoadenosine 5'-phosphosulfate sulfotransferase (PAPS reductase)/FAD synthetase